MVAQMVRGLLPELSPDGEGPVETAPTMFTRPSDVPEPLEPMRNGEPVVSLHREWLRIEVLPKKQKKSPNRRLMEMVRRVFDRVPGGVDRVFVAEMIRAIDAVAVRCDEISERLTQQQIIVDEMATIFGEELTRLRAESAPLIAGAKEPPPAMRHE